MVPSPPSNARRRASRLLGVLAGLAAAIAAVAVLWPRPLADVFVTAWILGAVLDTLVGTAAAWTGRRALLWVATLLLAGFAVVGMLTVGWLFAPSVVLLLAAALLSGWAGPVLDRPEPSETGPRRIAGGTLAGAAAVGGGAAVVRVAAFDRELFGSCAAETPACVLATTNWPAVAATTLALATVALGGRLLLRQTLAAWALIERSAAT